MLLSQAQAPAGLNKDVSLKSRGVELLIPVAATTEKTAGRIWLRRMEVKSKSPRPHFHAHDRSSHDYIYITVLSSFLAQ